MNLHLICLQILIFLRYLTLIKHIKGTYINFVNVEYVMENKSDKLTVNQRINLLLDPDSFVEFGSSTGKDNGPNKDGVITGYGKINERPVYIYAQDFSYMGGSMGKIHCKKILGVE